MKFFKTVTVSCCALSLVTFLTAQAWAISLYFNPSSSTIGVGEKLVIDLFISGLASDNVSGFDFSLEYDSEIVGLDSYEFGSELGDISLDDASDYSDGDNLVEVSWLSDFSLQAESFALVSLTFTGLSVGTTNIGISGLTLSDDASIAQLLTATIESGSIDVAAPVPEPATMLLFGAGLLGLAGARYTRNK